jgi:hypothetical protein
MTAQTLIKRAALAGLTTLTAVAMIAPTGVAAKDGEVIRTGACTNRSDWKLKLSPENGRIEVQFEVDTPRVGQVWRVRLFQNGNLTFQGTRTTQAPSGSFELRVLRSNTGRHRHLPWARRQPDDGRGLPGTGFHLDVPS